MQPNAYVIPGTHLAKIYELVNERGNKPARKDHMQGFGEVSVGMNL